MKKVLDHRYAKKDNTAVYDTALGEVAGHLPRGTWIGVLAESDGWYRVITPELDGWVQIADTEKGEDLKLSIIIPEILSPKVMHYALSA